MVKKAAHAIPNRHLRAARKERGWTQRQVADRIGAPLLLNISRWENGTAFPSAYYLEKLCQLFSKSIGELGLSQLEGETQGEQQATMTDHSLASTSTYEAGYRADLMTFRNDSHPLSLTSLIGREQDAASVCALLQRLEVEETTSAEQLDQVRPQTDPKMWTLPYPRNLFFLGREEVLARLRRQLQAGQMMALSQPQAISPEFLPSPMRGHFLLTTRAQALGRLANRIEVETLDPDTATLLLPRRAGLLALDAPLAQADQTDLQAAGQLSQELVLCSSNVVIKRNSL